METIDELNIWAFRAVDHPDLCEEYLVGHARVLSDLGIKNVTSAKADWPQNEYSYVIGAWSVKHNKLVGGARIDVAGKGKTLPIEDAVGVVDDRIFAIVDEARPTGTAELCGLWTDMCVSGQGTAVLLIRTAVSILEKVGVSKLFVLCAEATLHMFQNVGCRILREVGKEGTFFYPKLDLIATALVIPDTKSLDYTDKNNRDRIQSLRVEPIQTVVEPGPKGPLRVKYKIEDLVPWIKIDQLEDYGK